MYKVIKILYLLMNLHGCLLQEFKEDRQVLRIENGWPAKLGDAPYQLAFKTLLSRAKKLYATFCGGVIISPSKVVTAAHCFENSKSKCFGSGKASRKKLDSTLVVAGNLNNVVQYPGVTGGQVRKLKDMSYPDNYKFPKHDIAVGSVKRAFVFNMNVAPIPFATKFADYSGQCLASGYGQIDKKVSAEKLLLVHLTLITSKMCNIMHRKTMDKFVCTSSVYNDVGKGDSGGPLVCKGTKDPKETEKGILVGIVSAHRPGVGSMFTRVSSYVDFIESNRGNKCIPRSFVVWICLLHYNLIALF